MPLAAGTRLGPYEVIALLGAGGMGEVYRGHDPRMGRDVAIKVLPQDVSADLARVRRFEQEARAAAALNHPNILSVYDVGQHDGAAYLVSELLDGETLRSRLRKLSPAADQAAFAPRLQRALTSRKAVEYAVQIARGLAAAHEKAIVHRDLKPENLFITTDERVKILDFGLAKLESSSPTQTDGAATVAETAVGTVLGTVGYMAPEQVRGLAADHRSDIFALGSILYEMLSGTRAFGGATSADVMTAVLNEEPPEAPLAERHVPPVLARVVRRCLEKNPAARFQSTEDLAFALEGLSTSSDASGASPLPRRRSPSWLPWGLLAATVVASIAASALALTLYRRPRVEPRPVRFEIASPGNLSFSSTGTLVAVSPDSSRVAIVSTNPAGQAQLWIRALDSLVAQPLAGTEGARTPFWSPDGRFIGFFAYGRLLKMTASGGPVETVTNVDNVPLHGAWGRNDVILFSSLNGPIQRVDAAGGESIAVTKLDTSRQEQLHVYPLFLPDGRRFLYSSLSADPQHDGIYVRSLTSDEARLVVRARSNFAYVEPGFLVYAREGVLMAQPFDAEAAVTTGDPVLIGGRVEQFSETGIATFSASTTGTLVYGNSEGVTMGRLLWFDRAGTPRGEIGDAGAFRNPRLSPNGSHVVVERTDASGNRDLWIVDVARGVPTRFTFDPGRDASPVWSADGREIAWQGNTRLYRKSASGAGREESLRDEPWIPDDWLPDGSGLLAHPNNPRQIWLLPLTAHRSPHPVVESRSITTHARVSPDGVWVAFATNESGRFEVHLQHLRGATGRWQVSSEGGIQPKWRRDGRELFYLALDGTLMAVPLKLGDLPEIGKPQPLFQTHIEATTGFVWHQYDVTPDGQRFLVNAPQAAKGSFTVVVNWPALLKP